MLLYAIYTPAPKHEASYNRPQLFAFASTESYIKAMKQYNNRKGKLILTERDELIKNGAGLATLIQWNATEKKCVKAQQYVHVSSNSQQDTWHGDHHEIFLVEKAADENIIKPCSYP